MYDFDFNNVIIRDSYQTPLNKTFPISISVTWFNLLNRHDITEILLKASLNTITLPPPNLLLINNIFTIFVFIENCWSYLPYKVQQTYGMVEIGNWIPTLLDSHWLNIWIYTVNRYKYKCFEEKGDKWFKISFMFLSKSHWLKRNLMYTCTNYVGLRIQLAIMTKIYDWKKIYRITTVLKVKTDIITSITASQRGGAVILVIMYVELTSH